MIFLRLILTSFFVCFLVFPVHAQRQIYKSYDRSSGLPSDYVFSIFQDKTGYMWFGTERGVAKYDGVEMKLFNMNSGLPDNFVFNFFEDSRGRLWLGNNSQQPAYIQHNQITRVDLGSFSSGSVLSFSEDSFGRIYVKCSFGIALIVQDEIRFFPVSGVSNKESLFYTLEDGRIFFATRDSLYLIIPSNDLDLVFETFNGLNLDAERPFLEYANLIQSSGKYYMTHSNSLSEIEIENFSYRVIRTFKVPNPQHLKSIESSTGGKIFVGTRTHGLYALDKDELRSVVTSDISQKNYITALFVDYENNLWSAAFGEAVEKITDWTPQSFPQSEVITDNNIWRIHAYNDMVFTSSQTGVDMTDLQSGSWTTISNIFSARGIQVSDHMAFISNIYTVYQFPKEQLFREKKSLVPILSTPEGVNDILLDDNHVLWVATAGKKLYQFDVRTGKELKGTPRLNDISSVEQLVKTIEGIWLLTYYEGAYRISHTGSIHKYDTNTGLSSNQINSIYEDDTYLYFGTDNGLNIKNKSTNRFETVDSVLSHATILGIFDTSDTEYDQFSVWVVSPDHIYKVVDHTIKSIKSIAFLKGEKASINRLLISNDKNNLILATGKGLFSYDLINNQYDRSAPKIVVESITFDEQRIQMDQVPDFKIRSASVTLDFKFTGLSFYNEDDLFYSHQLIDVDSDWSAPHSGRSIRYANIPNGSYTFMVKAINSAGLESEEAAIIHFKVHPPFWKTTWFLAFITFFLISGTVYLIHWRVKRINQQLTAKNEQKQFETIQRITASIAHDIRNTVFSLQLLAGNLEKRFDNPEFRKDAIETIESSLNYLSKLVLQISQKPQSFIQDMNQYDIHETIKRAIKRMGLDKYKDITLQTDLNGACVCRHDRESIERVIENLIQNAVDALREDGKIIISSTKQTNGVHISISDNGPGMDENFMRTQLFKPFSSTKTKGIGLGLYTCREIIQAHNGSIDIKSSPGKGSTFTIYLP